MVVAEENTKRHVNMIIIGHVDAGKSTIRGQILFLSGQIDDETIQKYEKEAKDKSRESWYKAYIMDTNKEEKTKGITFDFETETTRFTILDCSGHKRYVQNIISGVSQTDTGVLVISARKGEFETGYEGGGKICEYVHLLKTIGVNKLLIVVNKMDDHTVNWSKERYDEIESKMGPILKTAGYNISKDVKFIPISGLIGANMKTKVDKSICSWWDGPCLFESLDSIEISSSDPNAPFRMPIIDRFNDKGTIVMGKVESGTIHEGDNLVVMPNQDVVRVVAIYRDEEDKVKFAKAGENIRVRLSGIEEDEILSGFVLSCGGNVIPSVSKFDAQLQILELPNNVILTEGYKAVLHIHGVVEECEIVKLYGEMDLMTRQVKKEVCRFVKRGGFVFCCIEVVNNKLICIEKFDDFAQLGRFTLRSEGKIVGLGRVTGFGVDNNIVNA